LLRLGKESPRVAWVDLLDQMVTFVRLVEGKSLSAAARSRRLSLPAVSRQLRALEADLGATLVVRSTRSLHVTEAGRRWYDHCVRILHEVEQARTEVRTGKAARGTLVVSTSLTFGTFVIVPLLRSLIEQHPALTIELRLEDQLIDIVAEGVDVAVRAGTPPPDTTAFVAHPLSTMRRILVASPAYLRRHAAPKAPHGLARHVCLAQVTPAGSVIAWKLQLADGGVEHTLDVRGPLRTNAPLALRDAARLGTGVAYLPDWLVAPDLESNALRRVLPRWASAPLGAWAIHRAELRGTPRLRIFVAALREASSNLALSL
jgi:DNA-binding transcriptional LysR family regulator